ncbi:MAG TPA: protein translocase subunit SecF, partial [Terriglobales bacterium]|nr:protein translocase subunit SecF [Terriglobales bacterium]
MELFRNTNIDFLGKKWYFLGFSLIFSIAGILSMLFWHGIPLGVDFRGGTLVQVKFDKTPDLNQIRADLDRAGLHSAKIQRYDIPSANEVMISLDLKETREVDLARGKNQIIAALESNPEPGKQNINNSDTVGFAAVRDKLIARDPLHAAPAEYDRIARQVLDVRDKQHGGILTSLDALQGAVPAPVIDALKQDFYAGHFGIKGGDIVGPQVGDQLKKQARLAVGFSLIGMLVYLWFRFELIYG